MTSDDDVFTDSPQPDNAQCQRYGITINAKAMRQQMRDMARQFNLSRPRGVSLKRPSPQLSRDKLGTMRVIARMNILYSEANQ